MLLNLCFSLDVCLERHNSAFQLDQVLQNRLFTQPEDKKSMKYTIIRGVHRDSERPKRNKMNSNDSKYAGNCLFKAPKRL